MSGSKLEQIKAKFKVLEETVPPFVLKLKRAMLGQSLEEDIYSGLLNVKDIRERTRLSEHDIYGHSMMRLLAANYEEMGIWRDIAEMEDPYFISFEGEQRKEAILMQRAKTQMPIMGQPLSVQLPEVETKPQEQKPEKKGFLRR